MRESDISERFAKFEFENDPYALVIRGVSLWRLVRNEVGRSLQNLPLSKPPLPLATLFSASIRSLIELSRLKQNQGVYAVRTYSSAMRVRSKSGYEDVYFEQILQAYPSGIRIHSKNTVGFDGRLEKDSGTTVNCTVLPVLGTILARILPVKEGKKEYEKLSSLLEDQFGLTQFSVTRISRVFSSFWWQSRIYEWIIRRLGVRVVIGFSGERALLAASRRLGIRFIELQHGIYTTDDPDCLPSSSIKAVAESALLLPDLLAMYGEYWTKSHRNTAMGYLGRLRAVGAPMIERYRRVRLRDFCANPDHLRLVVTTQGLDREALINFLTDFLDRFCSDCTIFIKLHPIYDVFEAPYLGAFCNDERVQVISGNSEPGVYDLIAKADLHLSIASACHYDAIGMGTPTVVLGLAGHTTVDDLASKGHALFVDSPEKLAELVSRREFRVSDADPEYFFRPDFVQNSMSLIKSL